MQINTTHNIPTAHQFISFHVSCGWSVCFSLSSYCKVICVYLHGVDAAKHTTACDEDVTKGLRCVDTSCFCDVITFVEGESCPSSDPSLGY